MPLEAVPDYMSVMRAGGGRRRRGGGFNEPVMFEGEGGKEEEGRVKLN